MYALETVQRKDMSTHEVPKDKGTKKSLRRGRGVQGARLIMTLDLSTSALLDTLKTLQCFTFECLSTGHNFTASSFHKTCRMRECMAVCRIGDCSILECSSYKPL
jgi:hypothetical protein